MISLILRNIILLFVVCFDYLSIQGQTTFQTTIGGGGIDKTNTIIATADNGFILAGESCNNVGGNGNAIIVKLNQSGQIGWVHTYGNAADKESLNDLKPTSDNGYIAVGERYLSTIQGRGEVGILLKTNASGNVQWWKEFDHQGNEAEAFSIEETVDQGFVMAGMMKEIKNSSNPFFTSKNEDQHLYILKTDKEGSSQWAGYITGSYSSKGLFIKQTKDKGYIITGHIYKTADGSTTQICLLKLDGKGAMQWVKIYDNVGKKEETGISIVQTADEGFMICGTTYDAGHGEGDVFLFKTTSSGEISWSKTYGGAKTELAKCMKQLPDGGYVITGTTNSFGKGSNDAFLFKVDDDGIVKWFKTYGSDFYEMASAVTIADDGFAMAGFNINSGTVDGFCIKTNISGDNNCSANYELKSGIFPLKVVTHETITWEFTKSSELLTLADANATGAATAVISLKQLCGSTNSKK